jgi:prolyl oligopeptidase
MRLQFNIRIVKEVKGKKGKKATRVTKSSAPKHAGVASRNDVGLPFAGSVGELVTDPLQPGAWIKLESWNEPPRIYFADGKTGRLEATALLQPPQLDLLPVTVTRVKVKSHDGVSVPLSIVHRKGLKLDGARPTLLTGYGAYGLRLDPRFNATWTAWLEQGGVMAVAHVRGGGEYGEEWHLAGRKATKPNTWKDFIACAEWLARNGYTDRAHLAGSGGSAGGITIGRAITERPELFSAAVSMVGAHDSLRAELTANGPPNIPEFGSTKTPEGFRALFEMSAYHHVRDATAYPAVLLTTGINDPRVDSWEPGKMAARLQAATASGKPVLLSVDFAGGHGLGSTRDQANDELADRYAFLLWQMGAPGFQPQ